MVRILPSRDQGEGSACPVRTEPRFATTRIVWSSLSARGCAAESSDRCGWPNASSIAERFAGAYLYEAWPGSLASASAPRRRPARTSVTITGATTGQTAPGGIGVSPGSFTVQGGAGHAVEAHAPCAARGGHDGRHREWSGDARVDDEAGDSFGPSSGVRGAPVTTRRCRGSPAAGDAAALPGSLAGLRTRPPATWPASSSGERPPRRRRRRTAAFLAHSAGMAMWSCTCSTCPRISDLERPGVRTVNLQ